MMRRRPIFLFWLLILILVYNGIILLITKTKVFTPYINRFAVNYVKEHLHADLEIGDLTLSDKQVIINDISLVNKTDNYIFNLNQLIVDYKLIGLIPGFSNKYRPLNDITAVNPEMIVTYVLPERATDEENEPFMFPNLSKYFGKLTLIDGSVKYTIISSTDGTNELYLSDKIDRINASITARDNEFELSINANNSKESSMSTYLAVKDSKVVKLNATLNNLMPAEVSTRYLEELDFDADVIVNYESTVDTTNFDMEAKIEDLYIRYQDNKLYIPKLVTSLVDDKLYVRTKLVNLDEVTGNASVIVSNPLSKNPGLSGTINVNSFNPVIILKDIRGITDGHFILSGNLKTPEVYGVIVADSIAWKEEKLTDAKLKVGYVKNNFDIDIDKANYKGNNISGDVSIDKFKDIDFAMNVTPQNENEQFKILMSSSGNISLNKKLTGNIEIKGGEFNNGSLNISDLNAVVSLESDSLSFVSSIGSSVKTSGYYLTDKKNGKMNLDLSGLTTNTVLANDLGAPLNKMKLYGSSNIDINNNLIDCTSALRFEETENLSLDSRVLLDLNYNLNEKLGSIRAETSSSLLNNKDFSYIIDASFQDKRIWINDFNINEQLEGSGWVNLEDETQYGLALSGKSISIREVLKYLMTDYQARQFDGYVDLDIDINSKEDRQTSGKIDIRNIKHGIIKPIDSTITFSGTSDRIELSNTFKDDSIDQAIDMLGVIDLKNKPLLTIMGDINGLFLSQVFEEKFNGIIDGRVKMSLGGESEQPILDVYAKSRNLQAYNFDITDFEANIKQYHKKLVVDTLRLKSNNIADINLKGAIGYNLLSDTNITSNDSLFISINSDIAGVLKRFRLSDKGKANTSVNLVTSMGEDGLNFHQGSIKLKNGNLSINSQLQQLGDMTIDISVDDDVLTINKFKVRSGDGYIHVRNELIGDEKDFILGNLKIGKLFVRTDSDGILVTVPEYSQENTLTNAIIQGRNSREATITGPFDDIYIEADVVLRNAMALYPPKVDNLLKLFTQLNPAKKSDNTNKEPVLLPFKLDTILYFDENSRYITHPANIPVRENSFIHLFYDREEWIVKRILLSAESGSFDFFGINFKLDYFEVGMNDYSGEYLLGELYHKTSDGTTILLTIDTDDDLSKSFVDRLQFNISSDNPNDRSIVNMLARVRYDSELSDLSSEQESSIWQDEALNLLDGNLNSYYLDPFLYPVENYVRKFLKLDFLYVDFGFLQNVYSNYIINEKDELKREESQLVEFSSSILLDNLKINAGKYLTRNIYFDYTALFQETTDLETKTNMLVNHNATFRFNLPERFKVSYTFGVEPDKDEMYSHEIMLQRTIRFDFNNYKYNKNRR